MTKTKISKEEQSYEAIKKMIADFDEASYGSGMILDAGYCHVLAKLLNSYLGLVKKLNGNWTS